VTGDTSQQALTIFDNVRFVDGTIIIIGRGPPISLCRESEPQSFSCEREPPHCCAVSRPLPLLSEMSVKCRWGGEVEEEQGPLSVVLTWEWWRPKLLNDLKDRATSSCLKRHRSLRLTGLCSVAIQPKKSFVEISMLHFGTTVRPALVCHNRRFIKRKICSVQYPY
jgi:hypothetical protein